MTAAGSGINDNGGGTPTGRGGITGGGSTIGSDAIARIPSTLRDLLLIALICGVMVALTFVARTLVMSGQAYRAMHHVAAVAPGEIVTPATTQSVCLQDAAWRDADSFPCCRSKPSVP